MKIIYNLSSCGTWSINVFPLHQKHAERISFTCHIDEMALTAIHYYFLWKTKACLQAKRKLELADLNLPSSGNCPCYKILQRLEQFQRQHWINALTVWPSYWLCSCIHTASNSAISSVHTSAHLFQNLPLKYHRQHFGWGEIWPNLPNLAISPYQYPGNKS